MSSRFGYDLSRTVDGIREGYRFDETCQGSVPEAIVSFLDAADFEGAVRNAVSLGGDADTQACIAGGIAEAFFGGVPDVIAAKTLGALQPWMVGTVERFRERFVVGLGSVWCRLGSVWKRFVVGLVATSTRHQTDLKPTQT